LLAHLCIAKINWLYGKVDIASTTVVEVVSSTHTATTVFSAVSEDRPTMAGKLGQISKLKGSENY